MNMKTRCALFLVATATGLLTSLGQEADWWRAERDLTAWLWTSNTPIATLVRTVTSGPVADGQAAMFKVSVLLRAGMNEKAAAALHDLKRVCPELGSSQIHFLYYEACDGEEAWDVAQALVEVFADHVTDLSLENRLIKHWLASGWTVEQVDDWLAARPAGIQPFWIKERLRFAQSHGRAEALLQRLSDGVRRNPAMTNAVVYLDALLCTRQGGPPPDLSWFGEVVKPARALDAQTLAERLQQLQNWTLAVDYYRQAIAIPLTDPEIAEQSAMRQALIPQEQLRAQFAVSAREAMSECLLKLGQNDAAQQQLVEAADIREQHGLRRNAFLAGSVQAETGQRTLERRIIEAEGKSDNAPEYWCERAQYYRGRQEPDREEEALKKGLSLTTPQLRPEHPGKGYMDSRSRLLSDYVQFLVRQRRETEALALLRQELADAPALAESAARAGYLLGFDFSKSATADDAVLWNWLSNRPIWGHTEERLLWRMLENAANETGSAPAPTVSPTVEKVPSEKLGQCFTRAETLVGSGNSSRAYALGWIMNRLGFPKRSIPLLQAAFKTATDNESKQRAAFALVESLLDTGDWKQAEVIFPEAAGLLTAREIPQWHSRLALAAARDGHKADALRLWVRTANVRPTATQGLAELARLGLRDDLAAFYRSMQEEMPASHAPARALELLEGK